MKISFDFDGVLDREDVQNYAKRLIDDGHELYIVTMRFEHREAGNQDIYDISDNLGIDRKNIVFTHGSLKTEFFKENEGFGFHLDDCSWQIININRKGHTNGIFFDEDEDWESDCNDCI